MFNLFCPFASVRLDRHFWNGERRVGENAEHPWVNRRHAHRIVVTYLVQRSLRD